MVRIERQKKKEYERKLLFLCALFISFPPKMKGAERERERERANETFISIDIFKQIVTSLNNNCAFASCRWQMK